MTHPPGPVFEVETRKIVYIIFMVSLSPEQKCLIF
jgi:hypothetical protein